MDYVNSANIFASNYNAIGKNNKTEAKKEKEVTTTFSGLDDNSWIEGAMKRGAKQVEDRFSKGSGSSEVKEENEVVTTFRGLDDDSEIKEAIQRGSQMTMDPLTSLRLLLQFLGLNQKQYIQEAPWGVEVKNGYVTKPQTREFEEHDKYMDEQMKKYDEEHPIHHADPIYGGITDAAIEQKDYEKRKEYQEKLEKEYRKSHPEYDVQATYYDAKWQEVQEKFEKEMKHWIYTEGIKN